MNDKKPTGSVKFWSDEKAWGFITPDASGDKDVFLHINQVRQSGIDGGVEAGQRFSYETEEGKKGLFAKNLKRIQ